MKPTENPIPFEIKDFRQPLITSLGVILGFIIGFLGQWITEDDFALKGTADALVFAGFIGGAALLLTALFRILNPFVSDRSPRTYYWHTLLFYGAGVITPLASMLVAAFI